eukprot:5543518-Pleurochrysis_carterae.AAC.1
MCTSVRAYASSGGQLCAAHSASEEVHEADVGDVGQRGGALERRSLHLLADSEDVHHLRARARKGARALARACACA